MVVSGDGVHGKHHCEVLIMNRDADAPGGAGNYDNSLAAECLPATNYAVLPHDDLQGEYARARRGEFSADPAVFVSSASLKDRYNPRLCPQGHTNLQLMSVVPPQPSSWELEMGTDRGEDYQAAKDALSRRMLTTVDGAFPGISDRVVYFDLSTPYTETRYMGVTDGTSYGIAATPDQALWNRPGPTTHVPGLYLAGASARPGNGIIGTMGGGVQAATAILGQSAIKAVTGA